MTLPMRRQRSAGLPTERMPGWRDPLSEFDDLFNRIGHLLESTVGGGLAAVAEGAAWSPLADVSETDEAYTVEIDLPGVDREDIDLEISDRELIIKGEIRQREREGVLRRKARRSGRFEYRALLPNEVDPERISAKLHNGVLTVTVPKAQAAKPRHIEIAAGG